MFKIIDVYIGKTISTSILLVLITFIGLSSIIKYVEQLKKVGEGNYDLLQALLFVILSIPRDLEMFFPMAVMLGSLIGLGVLAENSELVVMQAAGFSKLNIGVSVLKTAVPLMFIMTIFSQWGVPQAQKMARDLRAIAISGGNLILLRTAVWARDSNDFIFMGKVEFNKIHNLKIWKFDDKKHLTLVISSKEANFISNDDTWEMKDAQITDMRNGSNISKKILPIYHWNTPLSPDKLAVVTMKPEELSFSGLYHYITYLENSEQDSSHYRLALWRKGSQPFTIAVMMLMAFSFIFGPLRSVTMGTKMLFGIIAGFIFYISGEFLSPFSLVYSIPPVFAAIAPNVMFLLVAIILLKKNI
ncbi:lipopolysaccharide export system permease protein lptG [Candidatus Photodesmus katoptron]|uniref:LPS export ABC transporter permease LptG n=1 Tax=Candidatus Photodesmus anomalopis TaxID=28176 RepID=UPI0004D7D2C7|nr:LPS export ABC transporter permease LptG [Candidatus Photodesmus katoptron]KEY90065.1 lipopolysaccharide export system permease protein lptG [Candidatus Photodesmus katoptron]